MNEQQKNKIREEYRLYLGTRCINHPDFFPDECCGTPDWFLSKIDELLKEQREELVDKIENSRNYDENFGSYQVAIDDIINLIKEDK